MKLPERYTAEVKLPDGFITEVVPLLFGRARINVYDGGYVLDCW